jgi:hypothetical protein
MADAFGLITSIVVSLTVLNLAPGLEVPPLWQRNERHMNQEFTYFRSRSRVLGFGGTVEER